MSLDQTQIDFQTIDLTDKNQTDAAFAAVNLLFKGFIDGTTQPNESMYIEVVQVFPQRRLPPDYTLVLHLGENKHQINCGALEFLTLAYLIGGYRVLGTPYINSTIAASIYPDTPSAEIRLASAVKKLNEVYLANTGIQIVSQKSISGYSLSIYPNNPRAKAEFFTKLVSLFNVQFQDIGDGYEAVSSYSLTIAYLISRNEEILIRRQEDGLLFIMPTTLFKIARGIKGFNFRKIMQSDNVTNKERLTRTLSEQGLGINVDRNELHYLSSAEI